MARSVPPRSGGFLLLVGVLVGGGLMAESAAGPTAALGLAALTCLVLALGCLGLSAPERRRVAALVLVASAGEVLGSLVLGLYAYRQGGIPAFVPPGHGVIFVAGLLLAGSAPVRRRPGLLVAAAIGATVALACARPPGDDWGGLVAAGLLIAVLLRARRAPLFACMVLLVDALELYSTAIGTWRWDPSWSSLGLTLANPPAGVALGYVGFDWLALRLAARPGAARRIRSARAALVRLVHGTRASIASLVLPSPPAAPAGAGRAGSRASVGATPQGKALSDDVAAALEGGACPAAGRA